MKLVRFFCLALSLAVPSPLLYAQGVVVPRDSVIFELANPLEAKQDFNWYRHGTRREHGAHQAMWEPLFVLDYATGELKGWLADSVEANDAMDEWTLTLRDGVTWSDGEKFNADDVVYTVEMVLREDKLPAFEAAEMRRALRPNTLDDRGAAVVNGIEKKDDLTIIFKLKEADPRFALKHFGGGFFGSFLIMPEHIWPDANAADFEWADPIGTGPYLFDAQNTDQTRVVWNRDPNWWGAKTGFEALPAPARLIWQYVADEKTSKELLVADKLDAAREYSKATFDETREKNPAIVGWSTQTPPTTGAGPTPAPAPTPTPVTESLAWNEPCVRQLEINTKVAPWNDLRMRKALSHLIDRKRLAEIGYGGTTTPSKTMFVAYGAMKPFIEAVAKYQLPAEAEIAKAEPLLAEAGYMKGADGLYRKGEEVLSAVITVNESVAKDREAARDLEAQLDAAGLSARLELVSNENYWGRDIPTGNYALAYGWLSCGSLAEPYTSMARYRMTNVPPIGAHSRSFNNTGRWDADANKAYEATLDKIEVLPLDDPTIPELVAEAYAYLDAEMPFIPLVQTPRIMPFNTTYWIGWPSAAASGVPMHNWGSAHVMIHALEKAPPPPPE
ncbi:ABC transporter substrate-binding protein [Sinorhizobium medicae]|nr:ABC transporter substrate-binding protein [Sinorhizobium medicae]MDX0691727.1 ABC transporter substrate-binding protein [Sinorhizobium medicae]